MHTEAKHEAGEEETDAEPAPEAEETKAEADAGSAETKAGDGGSDTEDETEGEETASDGDQGNILRTNHQFYKVFPVKHNQEQFDELELEAKIQGTKISNVRIQVAENGQSDSLHRNGNREGAEKQVEHPVLPGPQDFAPDENAVDNVGASEETEEVGMMDRPMAPPSAADENPSPAPQEDAQSRWLQTLSEPELDFLISLRELSDIQAAHPDLVSHSHRFHLRTLRALGIVLLEHFRGQLKQNSSELHRLALLRDSPDHMHQQVRSMSNGSIDKKRKQLQHTLGEQSASSSKKGKWT